KGGDNGLAPMQAEGVFIGFATASEALSNATTDGSIYTLSLAKHLSDPGLSILDMHTKLQKEVKKLTASLGEAQLPFQYSGLDDIFYLAPGAGAVATPAAATTVASTAPAPSAANAMWAGAVTQDGTEGSHEFSIQVTKQDGTAIEGIAR